MRALIFILLCLLPLSASADSGRAPIKLPPLEFGSPDNVDIRNFIWGVKPADVRAFEQATFFDEVDQENGHSAFFYLDHVMAQRTLLTYRFYQDRLWQVRFDFQKKYLKSQEALDDFMKTQAVLDRKFGASKLEMEWRNALYKSYPNEWAQAVRRGDLIITARWDRGDTTGTMTLGARNGVFQWQAVFAGKNLSSEITGDRADGAAAILPEPSRVVPLP
jgi:hypothetical protein